MDNKYIKKDLTLTKMAKFLNQEERFKKSNKTDFTTNDVWQYIRLGHIPHYIGGNKIEKAESIVEGIKVYNILEKE